MSDRSEFEHHPWRFAMRDASWYDRPDVRSPKVYHAIISPQYVPACNTTGAFLVPETECSATAATAGMVCRRRACWSRYQAAVSGEAHDG